MTLGLVFEDKTALPAS